jgi:hypothetical protein
MVDVLDVGPELVERSRFWTRCLRGDALSACPAQDRSGLYAHCLAAV